MLSRMVLRIIICLRHSRSFFPPKSVVSLIGTKSTHFTLHTYGIFLPVFRFNFPFVSIHITLGPVISCYFQLIFMIILLRSNNSQFHWVISLGNFERNLFTFNYVYMYVYVWDCLCEYTVCTGQKTASGPLEPQLQAVVSHPTRVLGPLQKHSYPLNHLCSPSFCCFVLIVFKTGFSRA